MKKLFRYLAVMVLMLSALTSYAAETTFDFSSTTKNPTSNGVWTKNGVTLKLSGKYSSHMWQGGATDNSMSVSSSSELITKIVVIYTAINDNRTGGGSSVTTSPEGYSLSGTVGTWANEAGSPSVTFNFTNSWRISSITVTTVANDGKTPTDLSFNNPSTEVLQGGTVTNTATLNPTIEGSSITYSSSDQNVATVNASTGEVKGVSIGKATITATYAGDNTYRSATASYQISVTSNNRTVALSVPSATVGIGETITPNVSVTADGELTSAITANDISFSITSGSDCIDLNGKTIKGVKAGTAVIRVSSLAKTVDGIDYSAASTLFTVTVSSVTGALDGTFVTKDFTLEGTIADRKLTCSSTPETGVTFTAEITGSSNSKSQSTINFNKGANGTITLKAPEGYIFTEVKVDWIEKNKGTVTSTTPEGSATERTANPYYWRSESNSVVINIESPAGGQGKIQAISYKYSTIATDKPIRPILSPTPGEVTGAQVVAIANPQSGVIYYYRTGSEAYTDWSDGSTSWTRYDQGINISASTTVSIAAVFDDDNSKVTYTSGAYTVNIPKAATPTFSLADGQTYTTAQSLEISSADDDAVTIHYYISDNTSLTTPPTDATWLDYTGAIVIAQTSKVFAYASGDSYNNSDYASITLNINIDSRTDPGLKFTSDGTDKVAVPETSATYTDVGTYTLPKLYNPHSLPVTYSLEGTGADRIASVDENGNVTVKGIGTVKVVATYASSAASIYRPATASYMLTINASGAKSVKFYSSTTELTNDQKVPDGTVVTLDIDNYPANYDVIVSMNDKALAYPEDGRNQDDLFFYLGRGIPVYVGDAGTDGKVKLNIGFYNPATNAMVSDANYSISLTVQAYDGKPVIPTAAPETSTSATGNKTIMTLSESSTISGDDGNIVYAKYSNSKTYLPRVLLAEPNISIDTTKTGVFSTLVSVARRTTAIQVKPDVQWTDNKKYDIASERMVVYYEYTPNRHKTRIVATPSPITGDWSSMTDADKKPTINASFYVDDRTDPEATLPTDPATITYDFESSNESVATVDENGQVTILGPGTATITISTDQVNGSAKPEKQGYDAASTTVSIVITDIKNQKLIPPTFTPETNAVYHVAFDASVKANAKPAEDTEETRLSVGDAYYVLESKPMKSYTAEEILEAVNNGQNGTGIVAVGKSGNVRIPAEKDGNVYTIWAVTYNADNKNKFSDVASIAFTYQYITVDAPVLKPGIEGAHNCYDFNTADLTVVASTTTPKASVYYTIDMPDDSIDITNSTLYEGDKKIKINKSVIIRAVAYLDGVYSPVVTYRYRKTLTKIDRPRFLIGENTYYSESGETLIANPDNSATVTLRCRVDDDADGVYDETLAPVNTNYTIYYTTDGTDPSTSSIVYSDDSKPTFNSDAIIRAFCVSKRDGSAGLYSTLRITITNGVMVWQANDETCDPNNNGRLYDNVISTAVENHNTRTAPEFITITIGGRTVNQGSRHWESTTVNEICQGHRIDGYGKYDIIAKTENDESGHTDAEDENGVLYNHAYAQLNDYSTTYKTNHADATIESRAKKVYESTFKLPALGTYVKFEPERDGHIYIWCLQNGGLHYSKALGTDKFYSQFIRKRPVYLVDESGHSVQATSYFASGTLNKTNWNLIDPDKLAGMNESQEGLAQTLFTKAEAQDIYNMYNAKVSAVTSDNTNLTSMVTTLNDGSHTAAASAGTEIGGADNVIDGTGYCLPSASYMKYEFPVKAGKTYFFFSVKSKIAITALGFKADNTDENVTNEQLTLDESGAVSGTSNSSAIAGADKSKTYDVTINRTFTANTWTSLVLPFSVSETQLRKIFGEKADVIHFTSWEPDAKPYPIINFTRHYHDMIVAGTPVLINPDLDVTNPKFTGVHIESTAPEDVDGTNGVTYKGTYDTGAINQYDFYLSKSGNLSQRTKEGSATIKGFRAWLTGFDVKTQAKVAIGLIGDEDGGETTGIIAVTADENGNITGHNINDGIVYNLNGQIITRDASQLNSLPAGVYILNGKKFVVK